MSKNYFEIWLDGAPLASAGDNWQSATKWRSFYKSQYKGHMVEIKRLKNHWYFY